MKKIHRKIIILLGSAALLLSGFCLTHGQVRTVRVYKPRIYNNTRNLMSNRAAIKKVVKKRQQKAKKRRQIRAKKAISYFLSATEKIHRI